MKKYPIGIQDFKKLREDGYLYVDKTEQISRLIRSGDYFFLSRPRRFGKSLLLSTIKYLFQGEKALFEGLWIGDHKEDWPVHPVLHFSFSALGYQQLGLESALGSEVANKAASMDISLEEEGLSRRFRELIQKLSDAQGKVVLLIDEYDKPLVDYIEQPEKAEANRDILKSFFSIIKDADPYLEFFLITGVSKFSKVSLFSDLNHLRDLTLLDKFSDIAGYTQTELDAYFDDDLQRMAEKQRVTKAEIRETIRLWYNGYRWGDEVGSTLYNPFSILNCFASDQIANYWWESGTPTFLIKQLRKGFHYQLEGIEGGADMFESYTLENLEWRSLLFQTGYLTIKGFDPALRLYTLGYPNLEVKDAMFRHLLASFRNGETGDSQTLFANLKRSLEAGDLERFIQVVNNLFSSLPHQLFLKDREAFFHAILHLSFTGLGLLTQSEVSTSQGRVDTVVHTADHIYVMEFKLDQPAASALAQIRDRRYGSPYLGQGKEVIALGLSFSSEEKAVAEWQAVPYEELLVEG